MLGWLDIALRLGVALLIGGVMGLNRDLHHKPTGLRTLGLVALGSALAVLAVAQDPQADISRVIQGVITGVGFIAAGVDPASVYRGEGPRANDCRDDLGDWACFAASQLGGFARRSPLDFAVAGARWPD